MATFTPDASPSVSRLLIQVSHRTILNTLADLFAPLSQVRLKMAQTVKEAVKLVEQGHIRVGPEVVTDPAFLVTR